MVSSNIEEGIYSISRKFQTYDSNRLVVPENGYYYCLEMIKDAMDDVLPSNWYVPMLVFDYLIGNSDRHQSNWAVIKEDNGTMRLCPLYDNGSSLCSFINEESIVSIEKDKVRFEALMVSKSRSCIRIDGYNKKNPTHEDVIRWLVQKNKEAFEFAKKVTNTINDDVISELLSEYPSEILTEGKNKVIGMFLHEKVSRLRRILLEVTSNE